MSRILKALLLCTLMISACRALTPGLAPTSAAVPALTLAALQNAEYRSADWGTFRLTDGLYERPPQNPGESASAYTSRLLEPAAFGDLNADGAEDAVVGISTQNGGTGHFVELAAVLNRGGAPQNVDMLSLGDRVVIEQARIESGLVTLNMRVHSASDGLCCPSQSETWHFELRGDRLIRVNPSTSVGAASSRP